MLRKLWNDDAGFIISAELVLVATILVIGMIVGLVMVRNQVVQELADVALAIGSISQSYAYPAIHVADHFVAYTDGAFYKDLSDYCQSGWHQVPDQWAGGIVPVLGNGAPEYPTGGERYQ
jgi:hypothetical protein